MTEQISKTRTVNHAPYVVEQEGKQLGVYWASSSTQAKAMHTERMTARRATPSEQIAFGRDGTEIVGMPGAEKDERQIDAFGEGGSQQQ